MIANGRELRRFNFSAVSEKGSLYKTVTREFFQFNLSAISFHHSLSINDIERRRKMELMKNRTSRHQHLIFEAE
jgi:hypothetical protein